MTEPTSWCEYEPAEIGKFLGEMIADAVQEWEDRAVQAERENTLLRERLHELEPSNGLLVEEEAA